MAIQAHANMVNWVDRFTKHFPYDKNVPRPANRQMMMDHPLYAFDLSPNTNQALRSTSNLNTINENYYQTMFKVGQQMVVATMDLGLFLITPLTVATQLVI